MTTKEKLAKAESIHQKLDTLWIKLDKLTASVISIMSELNRQIYTEKLHINEISHPTFTSRQYGWNTKFDGVGKERVKRAVAVLENKIDSRLFEKRKVSIQDYDFIKQMNKQRK
jgi:hypothetical protein